MIEWVVVDVPVKFPQTCIADGVNQKGPMVDTHRELPNGVHVYLSDASIKKAATLLGYIEGDEAEKRQRAIGDAVKLERELEQAKRQIAEYVSENGVLANAYEGSLERIKVLEGRIEQLETRLRERAQADAELVAGGTA